MYYCRHLQNVYVAFMEKKLPFYTFRTQKIQIELDGLLLIILS